MINRILLVIILLLSSCLREESCFPTDVGAGKVPPGQAGSARVTISLGRIGSLSKSAISLCSLYVTLTASGETPIQWVSSLSGLGPVTISNTFTGLAAKTWSLTAESRDNNQAIIHSGSTSFTVIRKQTVNVNLNLGARYSMLTAKFYPIFDSVTRCVLIVDSTIRDDSSFTKQSLVGDTIPLYYDYLATGVNHKIEMKSYGDMWGFDTLLYSADTTIFVIAGVDTSFRVTLKWVGPASPPSGQAKMFVLIGSIGTITVNGIMGD
jgi:hypothetical protein